MRSALLAILAIASAAAVPAQDEPESVLQLRIHDVRDLLGSESGKDPAVHPAELIDVIRYAIPGIADRAELTLSKRLLVAKATPADQAAIERQIEALRSGGGEAWLIELALAWGPSDLPADSVSIDGESRSRDEFIEDARAQGDVVAVPSLVVQGAQHAAITTGKNRSFITGYRLVRAVEGRDDPLPVPEIREIFEGLSLRTRLVAASGGSKLTLLLGAEVSRVLDPVPTRTTAHGPVHAPEVDEKAFSSHIGLSPGQAVMLRTSGVPAPLGDKARRGLTLWVKVTRASPRTETR